MTVFAERLRSMRAKRRLTQSALGSACGVNGVSGSHVAHFEGDRRKPSFENFVALADALDCSLDYLAGRRSKP